jgi:hypothetical protein
MSVAHAQLALEQLGLPKEQFQVIHALVLKHRHDGFPAGGQHVNGGCHRGSCDFFCAECAAWTSLLAAVGSLVR